MTNARPSSIPGVTSPRWTAAGFLAALGRRRILLLIAKLKRLARNVTLVCRPIEAGVEFIAADLQTVNKLTIHILTAVAEEEARMTSVRMNAALAAAKARGVRLGNPHLRPGTREQAFAANHVAAKIIIAKARRYAAEMVPVIRLTQAEDAGWLIRTTLNPQSGTNRQQHG